MLPKTISSSVVGLSLSVSLVSLPINAIELLSTQATSGYYNNLVVGVNPVNNTITGYYENATGWNEQLQAPQFTCSFYFTGTLQGNNRYQIRSWHPEDKQRVIEGNLAFQTPEDEERLTLNLQLEEEHGGCGNVQHFATQKGATFPLTQKTDWIEVDIVSSPRAYFHGNPNLSSKQKSYLIKGDLVKIWQEKNEWVEAEYGQEKITRGWIKKSDLDRR